MARILITGANGYMGRHLTEYFAEAGHDVIALMRRPPKESFRNTTIISAVIRSYDRQEWEGDDLFDGLDVVIHTAGRAHHGHEKGRAAELQREANETLAVRIATLARQHGVKRFIFISSIGAALLEKEIGHGQTTLNEAWDKKPYRAAKLEAERRLMRLHQPGIFEVVILRLPMVYGKDAPGNPVTLLKWIGLGLPLPFAGIQNRRAFISIDTIKHFMNHILQQPEAAGGTWAVRDADEISTATFAWALAEAAGKKAHLFPCPSFLLALIAGSRAESLLESLHIDLAPAQQKLGWKPPFTTAEGLRKAYSP
jgi:nucleoside-diphosphate-sugar epimerase